MTVFRSFARGLMRGSLRVFKHPSKSGIVVLPGNFGDEVAVGTLKSIWKRASTGGLK